MSIVELLCHFDDFCQLSELSQFLTSRVKFLGVVVSLAFFILVVSSVSAQEDALDSERMARLETHLEYMATKQDIAELRAELKRDIVELRMELEISSTVNNLPPRILSRSYVSFGP